MMQAVTTPLNGIIPPKPTKGDIESCRQYANHLASKSKQANATLANIWIRFIKWSYLQDKTPAPKYTGWKQQQTQLKALGVEVQA